MAGPARLAWIATGGTIYETGTIIAGTLSGSSAGATTLIGAHFDGEPDRFNRYSTAAGFSLNDDTNLSIMPAL